MFEEIAIDHRVMGGIPCFRRDGTHSRYFKSASQMVSDWLAPTGT